MLQRKRPPKHSHEMQAEIDRLLRRIHLLGGSTAKKWYPGTRIRRLTFTLPVKTLAELFAAMVTGEGGLNIQTEAAYYIIPFVSNTSVGGL